MKNLFKSNEGFNASTFTGLVKNGIEEIPDEIVNNLIQVDEQTYQDLYNRKLMWQNGVLVPNPNYNDYVAEQEALKQKKEYKKELAEIQAWFSDNDWKPNKIITGEWQPTDERWTSYLSERAIKRQRQDYLINLLKNNLKFI